MNRQKLCNQEPWWVQDNPGTFSTPLEVLLVEIFAQLKRWGKKRERLLSSRLV
jgi:hypothetical protein